MQQYFIKTLKNILHCIADNFAAICAATFICGVAMLIALSIYHASIQPTEGVVIRKDYYPASTHTTYTYVHQSDGKSIRVPVQKYDPERYQITIRGINSKGEEGHGYYDVTPQEYKKIQIGDYYIKQIK